MGNFTLSRIDCLKVRQSLDNRPIKMQNCLAVHSDWLKIQKTNTVLIILDDQDIKFCSTKKVKCRTLLIWLWFQSGSVQPKVSKSFVSKLGLLKWFNLVSIQYESKLEIGCKNCFFILGTFFVLSLLKVSLHKIEIYGNFALIKVTRALILVPRGERYKKGAYFFQ